jgi:hypothetical protein
MGQISQPTGIPEFYGPGYSDQSSDFAVKFAVKNQLTTKGPAFFKCNNGGAGSIPIFFSGAQACEQRTDCIDEVGITAPDCFLQQGAIACFGIGAAFNHAFGGMLLADSLKLNLVLQYDHKFF